MMVKDCSYGNIKAQLKVNIQELYGTNCALGARVLSVTSVLILLRLLFPLPFALTTPRNDG